MQRKASDRDQQTIEAIATERELSPFERGMLSILARAARRLASLSLGDEAVRVTAAALRCGGYSARDV